MERQCIVDLSELLFDTDYCGHDMRRLKSVSLTIPYVTGPYTVNLSQRASGGSTDASEKSLHRSILSYTLSTLDS